MNIIRHMSKVEWMHLRRYWKGYQAGAIRRLEWYNEVHLVLNRVIERMEHQGLHLVNPKDR